MTAWRRVRLKYVVDINRDVLRETTAPDTEFRYIDISTCGRGALVAEPELVRFGEAPSRARRLVSSGDTIVSTVRTYLRAVWRVTGPTDNLVVSTGFAVLSPRPGLVPEFLGWLMQSDPVIEEIVARSVGVSYPAINGLEVGEVVVSVPDRQQQRAIADYLDAETTRINAVVSSFERQLGLLAVRKRVTVSDTLKAHSTGEVPVRRLVTTVTSGPRGWSGLDVEGSTHLFLRIANVAADSIGLKLEDVAFINAPGGDESDRCRVRPGDVLTTITAAIGQVAVVPPDLGEAYISQHLALLRPDPALVMPEWLALALWSDDAQRQLDAARYGGTKQQLSLDDVREVRLPLAEMPVQVTVVPRALASLETVTQAERRIRRVIDLLLERRQALITAAVTGQLEMPRVAA